ncbi:MAG: SigB/SigF/SigG family RNA polymerase sigma factor [Eubacteriales bacterium]|nr:SigB/SigF/SigG family RNA polymerase sigma factor [Eubacteriales bacterium]
MNSYDTIRLATTGDVDAREQLVSDNSPLVWSIVRRFMGRGYEVDDLFQVGCMGLIKAIDRFDFSYGVQFSTYAVPMITGEIKRYIRDDGVIKVSRHLKELWIKICSAREQYIKVNDCEPPTSYLAQLLEVSEDEIILATDASRPCDSFDRELGDKGKNTLGDTIESKTDTENSTISRLVIREAMGSFTVREQQIIAMRYFYDKTQTQVAHALGISQVQVSRIEKRLLLRMREMLAE